ncbi:amidohydrolase [Bacillus sp. S/N-304-OC-R1]|uniref:amidohydrolase n=1 Tax=Bacillus sp. S/N-304-OC-R1 TaxID=2758034 RepID=UPI001C8D374F|nr:amidohydrolase [Bacillus sp. S/N-304-OC-R1]MBY0122961.1 amidohydrolase [Bacillus sp. S/N-304-OC-R1]
MTETKDLNELVEASVQQVVEWRRQFHEHPELSYQEEKTSQFVYETLLSYGGLEVTRPTRTSVVARLIGERPGKVLAMRADMDALPIHEESGLSFSSKNPGIMHACGHDGHTAMLLGAAKILVQFRDQIDGEIRFIFQHAEELFPGGAKEMVEAGVMDGVDEIIGLHLFSMFPTGKIHIGYGPYTANSDVFDIEVIGKGGHSSQPHVTIDPIAIGAQIVNNIQHIMARNIDPLEQAVVSVTEFHGGTAKNIIPDTIKIGGSVRSFSKDVREKIAKQLEQIVKGVTEAHQASYKYDFVYGYTSVNNDQIVTNKVEGLVLQEFGPEYILQLPPFMGGEDFSAFLEKVPGCFIGIGAADPNNDVSFPHHHPKFDIDERALGIGLKLLVHAPFHLLK